jgi:hypothetical protein
MELRWGPVTIGAWSGQRYWQDLSPQDGRVDAYMVWADITEFTDIKRNSADIQWVPLLLELKEGDSAEKFAEDAAKGFGRWIRVPQVYRRPAARLDNTRFCTAAVTKKFFQVMRKSRNHPLLRRIRRFEMGLPTMRPDDGEFPVPDAGRDYGERVVVVGTIDDNFAFAHARFRDRKPGSMRIDYFWMQDPDQGPVGGFGYGREISAASIGNWLEGATIAGVVDEDAVYRTAGYRDVRKRLAHGTHVMDISCGEKPEELPQRSPRMVCVQFPSRDNWGAMPLGAHVLDGLRYILDRADRIARGKKNGKAKAAVVVNLAHANLAGPHDGSSMLESAMDDLIANRQSDEYPFEVVLPAGNNHLSRCHARFTLEAGESQVLEWRILPDDATPNFLEIWLTSDTPAGSIEIQVTPPGNRESESMKQGAVNALRTADGRVLCTVVYLDHAANGDGRLILLAVAPTSTHRRRQGGAEAPSGVWRVRVRQRKGAHGPTPINAWIQRDDPVLGQLPYGRQSRFDDANYVRFETPSGRPNENDGPERSYVKRAGAINAIATGTKPIVIGGFRRSDGKAAPYAGSGPVPPEGPLPDPEEMDFRLGPDALAISDDSAVQHGVLGAGTRSGCVVAMDGTSVAVAQITRWVASQMAAGAPAGRKAVAKFARNREKEHEQDGQYKRLGVRERFGAGRSDVIPKHRR